MQYMSPKMSLNKDLSFSVFLALFLSVIISLLHIRIPAFALAHDTTLGSSAAAAGNETDFHALLSFKSKILEDRLGALSSWNDSLHFCEWQGITCNTRRKRVTRIDLASRGLVGSLTPHLGNLSFLRDLGLDNNSFLGEIPPELGNLFRLQRLSLNNSNFHGKIPANLSRCSNLMILQVGDNKLVGEFPKQLASLSKLTVLYIYGNNLTGGIPPFIANLTSLNLLSVARNPFGGSIPESLGQLENLIFLGLGGTQLSGPIPPSTYNLSLLRSFSVPENQLWGSLQPNFGFMFPHLQFLQLRDNQFTGLLPPSLSNSSGLTNVELIGNSFNGKITTDFGNLQHLTRINLAENNFGSGEPDEFAFLVSLANSSKLSYLGMSTNQFGGVLPDTVGNLSRHLSWFTLDENKIYGTIPSTIGNLVNLESLTLARNQFTGAIPTSIGYLYNFKQLDLSTNKVSGRIPDSIGNLSLLLYLDLGENRLEGKIPLGLGNCQNLLALDLSGNNMNGTIPGQLLNGSSQLVALDLSRNRLSGSLPAEVGNLKSLAGLDVSENWLSGGIPTTIGSCTSLDSLYLQENFIQGSIPLSLKALRGIQNLDLSRNNLSGQIPTFLESFSLKNLNLSFNDFEGELPMKGVFTNASAISVAGNYRLCGGIPELQLPSCMTKKSQHKMPLSQALTITAACILVGITLVSAFIICRLKKKRNSQPTSSLLKEPFLKVTYGQLLKATDGFSSINLIGFGSFGSVYKGILDRDCEYVVAVKVLNLQSRGATKSFTAECETLRNIRHRNLVRVITSCSSVDFQRNEFKALVYEFMPNGSLEKWLHPIPEVNNGQSEPEKLNLMQRVNIAIDVACALDYLHHQCQRPIIHCDLKPSNILLDGEMTAHVGDFGLARFCSELTTPHPSSSMGIRGTIGYAAPEYGLGSEMSTNGDVYSYGILLLEMITGKRPTDGMFEGDLNLHSFARMALPECVMEIVDPLLLTDDGKEAEANQIGNGSRIVECVISMVKIGVACSTDSPESRMSISNALHELHHVKNKLLQG